MFYRIVGFLVIIFGVILTVVSLTADLIGIGWSSPGFGRDQLLATAFGLIFVILGVLMVTRRQEKEKTSE